MRHDGRSTEDAELTGDAQLAGTAGAPPSGRLVAVVAGCAAAVGVLDAVAARLLPRELDRPLLTLAERARTPALDRVAVVVTDLGSPAAMTVVAAVVVAVLVARRRWVPAVGLAVAAAAGGELSPLLKAATGRARPPVAEHVVAVSGSAFPSGHALGTTVVLGLLAVVAHGRLESHPGRRWRRAGLVATAGAVVLDAAVGVSRVVLGVHWPTDVVAGWAVGVLWVCLVVGVRHAWIRRPSWLRQPAWIRRRGWVRRRGGAAAPRR